MRGCALLFDHLEGAEQEATVAGLVWVANEVSVQLLVTFQCDATLRFVVILKIATTKNDHFD